MKYPAMLFAVLALFFAVPAHADTVPSGTPYATETFVEPSFLGNDVLMLNTTPTDVQASMDAIIDPWLAKGPSIYQEPEYEVEFFSDGDAYAFQVPYNSLPVGETTGIYPAPTSAPEPSTLWLLGAGFIACVLRKVRY